jgi:hypothetical protein
MHAAGAATLKLLRYAAFGRARRDPVKRAR